MSQTILLMSSDHSRTAPIRAALVACPTLAVGGDVRTGAEAVRLAARDYPDAIVLAADSPGRLLVPLVRDLRAASDASQIVVIGELAALDGDTVASLVDLGIAACVLRSEALPEALPRHVATVLDDEALVISRGLLERRQGPRIAGLMLTVRERATLHGGAPGGARVTLWLDDPTLADSLRFYATEASLMLDWWTRPTPCAPRSPAAMPSSSTAPPSRGRWSGARLSSPIRRSPCSSATPTKASSTICAPSPVAS